MSGSQGVSRPGLAWRPRAYVSLLVTAACLLAAGALQAQNPITAPYKSGFPLVLGGQSSPDGTSVYNQPLAVDLGTTPGFKSLVFGLRNGKLYVVEHKTGSTWGVRTGWPRQILGPGSNPAHIASSAAVGDLNGNGTPDIVVGYGSTFTQTTSHGGARAYDLNGNQLWDVQTQDVTPGPANGLRDPVFSTPAIGDLDGDGTVEVVFGGLDHKLYVVNGENGLSNNPAIWPKDMLDTVFSSPALHDIDGDGRLDIVIGIDAYLVNGGRLQVLRFDGSNVSGFPKTFDQTINSSPSIGDVDGDGQPEIVHGTGNFWTDANNGSGPAPLQRLYAWNCDGTAVAGFPVTLDGQVATSPALANLDGDPQPEIVVSTDNSGPSHKFHLYAWNGNGSKIFGPAVIKDSFGNNLSAGEPVVGDVLGDAALEILLPTNSEAAVFSTAGVQLTEEGAPYTNQKLSFNTASPLAAVAVTDLETNGAGSRIEVVAVAAGPFGSWTDTVVHVWNPVDRTSSPPWGFFRRDERRRGVVAGTAACGGGSCAPEATASDFFTLAPCRVVDTRNANGPRGGPAIGAGGRRTFPIAGNCGVPAGAQAVSVNVTVTQAGGSGLVRFAPGGCANLPAVNTISFSAGQTRANNAILALAPDGSGGLTAEAEMAPPASGVHLIIDVNGYFL
jgi:hypothetical protein